MARSRRSLADQPWNIIDDSDNDDSDGAAESSVEEEGILSKYTITLDFELPVEQQEISRASLLLQQVQTDTFNNAVLDVNQVVEIRTVINNVRYFVEKKEVDVYAAGSQSFDITRAAELWVEEEVSGQVLLEVLVRCYSSPNCTEVTPSGKKPAVVSFFHNTTDTSKLPRIITISKNPLEGGKEWRRKKREEEEEVPTVTEPVFCAENDTSGFCCLHPLILRFDEDLNMPFVSKPKSFEANFCDGYCPEVSAIGVGTIRRYELLQALSARPTNSIEPCCTGLEYKPLQVVLSIWNYMTGKFTSRQDRLAQVEVVKCRCG